MIDGNASQTDPLEALVGGVADEFTQRLNRGEQPDVEDYVRRHPELADLLRDVLPALCWLRTPADDLIGPSPSSRLGDYRLLREVGRGGMGVVYEAEQISLGRRVALKVLPFAATLDPRQRQRFHNEAQAAALLSHGHIVPVYAVGSDRGVSFYAMQFIEGRTLAEMIADMRQSAAKHGSTPPTSHPAVAPSTEHSSQTPTYFRTAARLGLQAAEALAHAHQQGVVHRDVKPANLMLDDAGRLWVTDFGLARCRSAPGLTLTGDLVGTLRYMSPEQALAKPGLIDHRSDLYSLGVTLYELLTLHPAYDGRDREELLRQLAVGEPRSPRRLNAAVPGELEKVVLKAMAREPERRYATGEELADDLRRFLDDRPVLARRPTLAMRVVKFGRRHRVATTAAAAVALAALVGLIVTFILVYREKERTAEALIKQEAEARRAQTNFRKALDGAKGLLIRLENRRWDGMAGIADLRVDVVGEGLRFFEGFIDESNPEPAVRFQTAQTYRLIAQVYCVQQDGPRAVAALDRAAAVLSPLVDSEPTSWTCRFELAAAHNLAGLLHFSLKQPQEAAVAFAQAAEQYRSAVPHDPGGESANACAWLLVDCPVENLRDPAAARALAEHAVARAPAESRFWNTLGVACYRAGDYQAAVTALERSMAENGGGNPWDWFFLAMAHHRLGADAAARSWHAKALRTLAEMAPQPEDLLRYRKEAEALMPEPRP